MGKVSSCNPCGGSQSFGFNLKTISTGLVTLVALGAIVTGGLTIWASCADVNGLNALSYLGLPGGISFLALGTLGLITLMAISYYRCGSNQTKPIKPKIPRQSTKSETPKPTSTPKTGASAASTDGAGRSEKVEAQSKERTRSESPPPERKVIDYGKMKGTRDQVREHLENIYGQCVVGDHTRFETPQPNDLAAQNIFDKRAKIYLMDDTEIRALTLEQLKRFSSEEYDALYFRVEKLVEKGDTIVVPPGAKTLFHFRQANFNSEQDLKDYPVEMFGLLTAFQLNRLLAEDCSKEFLSHLLPASPERGGYTASKLSEIDARDQKVLLRHLDKLGPEQLRLLPEHIYEEDRLPWDIIGEKEFKAIFRNDVGFSVRTGILVALLPMTRIQATCQWMSAAFLSHFTSQQLADPTFPWNVFLSKQGIGWTLHNMKLEDVVQAPFEQLMQNEAEFNSLFSLGAHANAHTSQILETLDIKRICTLAPCFKVGHLDCFSKERLEDKAFPWSTFLEKEGIGNQLQLCVDKFESFSSFAIPWNELAGNEVKKLFQLPVCNVNWPEARQFYENLPIAKLLRALGVDHATIFAPYLSPMHVLCYGSTILSDPEFPWSHFFRNSVILSCIRSVEESLSVNLVKRDDFPWEELLKNDAWILSIKRDWPVSVINSIPTSIWSQLAEKPHVIKPFFKQEDAKTISILQSWTNWEALRVLAPVLDVSVLKDFKESQRIDQDFPWDLFIQKEGIGEIIRGFIQGGSVAQYALSWNDFAQQHPSECKHVFSIQKLRPTAAECRKETMQGGLLNKLGIKGAIALACCLEAEHIIYFGFDLLTDLSFPWPEFLKKTGIETHIKKLEESVQIALLRRDDFPWERLCQEGKLHSFIRDHLEIAVIKTIPDKIWSMFVEHYNDEIKKVFSLSGDIRRTESILEGLGYPTIALFAPSLELDHLNLGGFCGISRDLKGFPWSPFVEKPGIGERFCAATIRFPLKDLIDFPWPKLALYPNEVEKMFPIPIFRSYERAVTVRRECRIDSRVGQQLHAFGLDEIKPLASGLKAAHILCINPQVLKEAQFPWPEFLEKEGIWALMKHLENDVLIELFKKNEFIGCLLEQKNAGSLLREWSTDVIKEIPKEFWNAFSQYGAQMELLLPLGHGNESTTKSILSAIHCDGLTVLAPYLKIDYLSHIDKSVLRKKEFPWPLFLAKPGIGGELLKWKGELELFTIPWGLLVDKTAEIDTLLPITERVTFHTLTPTEVILQNKLGMDAIKQLAPGLKKEHRALFSDNQKSNPQFPTEDQFGTARN